MPEITIDIDRTEAEETLRQLEQHGEMVFNEIFLLTTKTYSSLALLGDIMGYAIPTWFNMMFSAALMASEMFYALGSAETISGILAWKAAMTFAASTLMFIQAMMILQHGRESTDKLNSIIGLINVWSTV